MSRSRSESVRRTMSDVRSGRKSSTHLLETPGSRTDLASSSGTNIAGTSEDNRRTNVQSYNKRAVHEILYVHPTLRVVVSGMSGLLFGIALEKSRVFEPQIIRDQMLFKRYAMMKMFLAAMGAGLVSFSVIGSMPQANRSLKLAIHEYIGCIRLKTVSSVVVGAGILGCGMTLAGACPGLVTVQLGAGVKTAVYTILGCLAGGFIYALLFPITWRIFLPPQENMQHFLHEYVDTSYHYIALPLLFPIFILILAMELYSPWEIELMPPVTLDAALNNTEVLNWRRFFKVSYYFGSFRKSYPIKVILKEETVGIMKAPSWAPYYAGILVGLLQIPVVLANQDTLGTSTSYVTIGAQLLLLKPLQYLLTYYKDYRTGWINWWQVFFIGGSMTGGFLSSMASKSWAKVVGVNVWEAFGGGLLMIYGARLAGGCTSGHGLSGTGLLALMSFVAVPSMFAGGIATAFTLRLLGVEGFK